MRIAIVAPPWLPVPPLAYGGTEAVLDNLARGLRDAGHDVLLCTTGDSTCDVPKSWVLEHSIGVGAGGSVGELRHVIGSYEKLAGFDIVHDHTLIGPIYAEWFPALPVVTTNHGPFESELEDLYRVIGPRVPIIAISRHQASTANGVPIAGVIHHGVFTDELPFGAGEGGYGLFLGRMNPGKGAHIAARVARAAGVPLRMAGKVNEPAEHEYFHTMVEPLLGGDIEFLGEVDHMAKVELLRNAAFLLNPIAWPEPFGMVMVEALSCGTPVITTPFGAAPEIVEHEVVGFVCPDEQALTEAVGKVGLISRPTCREHVESHFSVARMVDDHVSLYERVHQQKAQSRLGLVTSSVPGSPNS